MPIKGSEMKQGSHDACRGFLACVKRFRVCMGPWVLFVKQKRRTCMKISTFISTVELLVMLG